MIIITHIGFAIHSIPIPLRLSLNLPSSFYHYKRITNPLLLSVSFPAFLFLAFITELLACVLFTFHHYYCCLETTWHVDCCSVFFLYPRKGISGWIWCIGFLLSLSLNRHRLSRGKCSGEGMECLSLEIETSSSNKRNCLAPLVHCAATFCHRSSVSPTNRQHIL